MHPMRLQIRTTATLTKSGRGTPTLVLSFCVGPMEVYVVANVPTAHGGSSTAYVKLELKERVLVDEASGVPEAWLWRTPDVKDNA